MVVWLTIVHSSLAQITVQKGKVVSESSSLISSNTPIVNYGEIVQRGTLSTESDLLNYGNYDATQGSLALQGSNQRIVSDSLTVAQLHIKGGNVKILEGKLEIKSSLYLEGGLLQVTESSQLTLDEQVAINQNNETSYVWGGVCHRGNGSKFFPVGTRDVYAPLTLTNVQGNNPLVKATYESIDGNPYWTQTQLAGTYDGSPVTITFNSNNPDYEAYAQLLSITAGPASQQTDIVLGSSLLRQDQSRYTLASNQPTSLPWISVGFTTEELQEEVYVPNAFSPEATNPEDKAIKVYGRYLSFNNFHFGVQDSWGKWVYQTTSLEEATQTGWTTAGLNASTTKFRYVVSGRFLSGNSFQHSDIIVKF